MARVPVANLKGPRGATGPRGPKGDDGLDGVNAVENDTAVAGYLDNPASLTNQAARRIVKPVLVNPNGLDRWRRRLGEAFFNPVGVIIEGDSITDGAWANNSGVNDVAAQQRWADGGYVGQLRRLIARQYGDPGEGYMSFPLDDVRWTVAGEAGRVGTAFASTALRFNSGGYAEIALPQTSSVDVLCMTYANAGALRTLIGGVDRTPTILSGGVDALTSGWGALNGTVTYGVESGSINVVIGTCTTAGNLTIHSGLQAAAQPVTAGNWYLVQAEIKPITNNRAATASMIFYNELNQIVGTEQFGDSRTISVNSYKQLVAVVQAPAGAVRAATVVRVPGSAVNDEVRIRFVKTTPLRRVVPGAGGARFISYRVPTGAPGTFRVVGGAGVQTDAVGIISNGDVDAKIRIHGLGLSGSTSRDHAQPTWSADARTNLMIGTYSIVEGQPGLVVIALGANDWNRQITHSITPDEYEANLELLIASATSLGASVLLVAGPRWSDDPAKPVTQEAFYARAALIAESSPHVSFMDLTDVWGDFESANAKGFMWDSPHPNLAGHGDYARVLWNVLTRPTEPSP